MGMETDVLISGGGVAGLAAAIGFGNAGFRVTCVDPAPPIVSAQTKGSDLRTTAFLQPARDFLDKIGIWSRFAPYATELSTMRIVDASANPLIIKDFVSSDISDRPFAWNLPNWLLRREMVAHLETLPNVGFRPGVGTTKLLTRNSQAIVRLSDATTLRARLVIGADGRHSFVRDAAGLTAQTTRFGQKALSFAVNHTLPHKNVSTEVHLRGGPFTLVPLPDQNGRPCSAVVWMEQGPEAARLLTLDDDTFNAEATQRSAGVLGDLTLSSHRTAWPIISQIASHMSAERCILIAEAAHVVPPIGAQGLNMSLADIDAILTLACAHPDRLGDSQMTDTYHKSRYSSIKLKVAGVSALNRASMASTPFAQQARALGLRSLHAAKPVRRGLMQLGLGASG
jgi:2-octaprenyl-6-methoxyphenol hydroxylase